MPDTPHFRTVIGNEGVGRVLAVRGESVLVIGDRVVAPLSASPGESGWLFGERPFAVPPDADPIAFAKTRGLKTPSNIARRPELVAELEAIGGDVVVVDVSDVSEKIGSGCRSGRAPPGT